MDTIENEIRFTMRMEVGLYEQLKQSAQKNRRSIAKELEHIVDLHFNENIPVNLPQDIANQFLKMLEEYKK